MRGIRSLALLLACSFAVAVAACGGGSGGGGAPPAQALTQVTPSQGPVGGGTSIALAGTGFTGATQVTLGGVLATGLVVQSDSAITCVTPAGAAGLADVAVTTPGGMAQLAAGFRYRPAPGLSGVAPSTGPAAGGTPVTLTGTGFEGGVTQVTFGPNAAGSVNVTSDTACTCVTPAGSAGPVTVTVTTPGGAAPLAAAFTYVGGATPLTITRVTPDSGFTSGGGRVSVSGTGFVSGTPGVNTITFDGVLATSVVAVDDSTLTCVTPIGASGAADVAVTNSKGTQSLAAGFTYFTTPPNFRATNARLDTDVGANESQGPSLCGSGANRYAVWADARNGKRDVYFNRSTDSGATWLATDVRLDTDATLGQYASQSPQVCCSGQYVYVVWADWRNSALDRGDIYFNRSTDYGATWLASDVRIDTDATVLGDAQSPQIACTGAYVYAVWPEARVSSGPRDIYFTRSTNNGTTWLATDVRLDTTVAGSQSRTPRMAIAGASIHVVWLDSRNDGNDINFDIYLNRSADNGATWLASDVRLDTDTAGSAASQSVQLAAVGSNVCVVWSDSRNGTADIYLNRSGDGGATWLATDKRMNTGTAGVRYAVNPTVALDGALGYVTWAEDRTTTDKHDVYLTRSTDGGANWLAADVRISTDTAGANQKFQPRVLASGGIAFLVWEDRRSSTREDLYYNVSADSGVNWLANDVRINDDTAGANTHDIGDAWSSGANFFVGWMDARNGTLPHDIYVTVTVP